MEFGQWKEWNVWDDLEWDLLQYPPHAKLREFIGAVNVLYRQEPALYERDFDESGFQWIDCNDTSGVVSFIRRGDNPDEFAIVVCNFAPVLRGNYRIGVPAAGFYRELLNTDAVEFWGSGQGNLGGKWSEEVSYHQQPYSVNLCLPPLSTLILKRQEGEAEEG
jgi:1,4-alpha-glucan branching enzyme